MQRNKQKHDSSNPFLTDKEVAVEITNRTGHSLNLVTQVLNLYYQIVEECVQEGLEVRSKMGIFSWRVMGGAPYPYFNPWKKEWMVSTGREYRTPMFWPGQMWKKRLRKATLRYLDENGNEVVKNDETDAEDSKEKETVTDDAV